MPIKNKKEEIIEDIRKIGSLAYEIDEPYQSKFLKALNSLQDKIFTL